MNVNPPLKNSSSVVDIERMADVFIRELNVLWRTQEKDKFDYMEVWCV